MSRLLARIALSLPVILAAVFVCFAAGTWLGGQFLVPEGQGLAGPVEAMGYGLVAGLLGLALAIFAAVRLPLKTLVACAVAGIVVIAALAVALTLPDSSVDQDAPDMADDPQAVPVPTDPLPTSDDERA